jgi:hypothetical protein
MKAIRVAQLGRSLATRPNDHDRALIQTVDSIGFLTLQVVGSIGG